LTYYYSIIPRALTRTWVSGNYETPKASSKVLPSGYN
jgi:hypothetical protein